MTKNNAKKYLRILLLLSTAISLYFVPWSIVWAWLQPLPDTIQEQIEQSIERDFEGAIVYVDQKGKEPEYYAAGWHDRDKKIPASPDALFRIASINKLYVAVAVTKLVKAGKISLDKTLAHYFPELADRIEYADRITVKMMVQHRSGIPNFTDNTQFWIDQANGSVQALDYALDLPANFKPGEDYVYSNTNYLLLSHLIENTIGYDHNQYIREEILQPLGLTRTFATLDEVDVDDVMSGYTAGYDQDLKTNKQGMLASAEDVGRFLRALNEGTVFNDGEQEIYSSIYVYEHTGLVPGYQSFAKYHKDLDAVVVLFMNTTNFEGYNWNLSEVAYSRIVKILKKRSDK